MIDIDTLQIISTVNIEGLIDTIKTVGTLDIQSIGTINTASTLDINSVPVLLTNSSVDVRGLRLDQIIPDTLITRVLFESQDPFWLKVLPYMVAIIVPVMTLIFTSLSARWRNKNTRLQIKSNERQAFATMMQKSRQKWIDELRKIIAEILTKSDELYRTFSEQEKYNNISSRPPSRSIKNKISRIMLLERNMLLYLDPTSSTHNELLDSIKILSQRLQRAFDGEFELAGFMKAINKATLDGRIVLDEAWEKIKEPIKP